jgi:hypothetical protein
VLFALACGRLKPHWVRPLLQCLALRLGTLLSVGALHLGHKCPCKAKSIGVALLAGRPEKAFPICNHLGKSMVGWLHSTTQRHYTQSLIPLSGLCCCSHAYSIVHLGSVKAPGKHGVHSIMFTQCLMHWDDGEPWLGGVGLVVAAG